MTYVIIAVVVIAVFVVVFKAMAASHRKWLLAQSPVGTWIQEKPDFTMKLQFDDEENKHAGTYYKITEQDSKTYREFGSWYANMMELGMLVIASEEMDKYPIGKEFKNTIRYTGPEEISITEDGNEYVLKRGTEELEREFEEMKKSAEQTNATDA